MLRKISLLCRETQVTIISTITSSNNNSIFHETFHLNAAQGLGGSSGHCVQLTSCCRCCTNPWSCWGSKKPPFIGSVLSPSRDSWQIMQGLAPKSNSCSRKSCFFCAEPLKSVCWALARCGDSLLPRCAAPQVTSSKLKATQAHSLETCRSLIKGNKLENFQ